MPHAFTRALGENKDDVQVAKEPFAGRKDLKWLRDSEFYQPDMIDFEEVIAGEMEKGNDAKQGWDDVGPGEQSTGVQDDPTQETQW